MNTKMPRKRTGGFHPCALAGLFLWAILLAGCSRPASDAPRPDVLLIVADSLAAGRVSAYGHWQHTTPFLDRLAREGVRAENAYAVSSWSVPSLTTLLTGLLPRNHGCRYGLIEPDGQIIGQNTLPAKARTLAETYRNAGYYTVMVTANPFISEARGYDRGFDAFACLPGADARRVSEKIHEFAGERSEKTPMFVVAHFADLSLPRTARHPWAAGFSGGSPEYKLWSGLDEQESLQTITRLVREDAANATNRAASAFRALRAVYDSELRLLDERMEQLVDRLSLSPDHLLLVTASHGEELLEHGSVGHGKTLFEEVLRVPLIARQSGRLPEGAVVAGNVWQPDIHRTLLEAIALKTPESPSVDGDAVSLYAMIAREETPYPHRLMFFETVQPRDMSLRALRAGPWKLTVRMAGDQSDLWLSHLEQDPAERVNLADRAEDVVRELTSVMNQWWPASHTP